jgi:uncharacterized cupin superfamily protein
MEVVLVQETVNIFEAAFDGRVDLGALGGSERLAAYLYEMEPGNAMCPYHYEYVEEWMLVITGEASVRTPEGERTVGAGELVRFPAGATGAHKVANRGEVTCRVMLFSERRAPAVSVYPDSNKLGVWPAGDDTANDLLFVRDTAVPWSHGEDGWDRA